MKLTAIISEELKQALFANGIGNGYWMTDGEKQFCLWVDNNGLVLSDVELPPQENVYVPPQVEVIPEPQAPSAILITQYAFRNRFTLNEKVAIEMATSSSNAQLAAGLKVYQADMASTPFINLVNPSTMAGVKFLETVGLIGAGRADVILSTDVKPGEEYIG
jgi:hypothetical protein